VPNLCSTNVLGSNDRNKALVQTDVLVLCVRLAPQTRRLIDAEALKATRTIPMPAWVKNVQDQWVEAANLTSGRLFRRVHKIGKAWGERLTEKAVWHVVREYAAKAGIDKLAPTASAGLALGSVTRPEANWSKFSFCSLTLPFRQPTDISTANSGFKVPSTTKSE